MFLIWCQREPIPEGVFLPCFIYCLMSFSDQPSSCFTFSCRTMDWQEILEDRGFLFGKAKKEKFLGVSSQYQRKRPPKRAVTIPVMIYDKRPRLSSDLNMNCLDFLNVVLLNNSRQDFDGMIGVNYPFGDEAFKTMFLTPSWRSSIFSFYRS